MKKILFTIAAFGLTACESGPKPVVDLKPVGDGLNFIGISIILGILLALIGAFIMKGGGGK